MLFKISHAEGDIYLDLSKIECISSPYENNKKYYLILTTQSGADIKLVFNSEKKAQDIASRIANICAIDTIKRNDV